MLRYTSSVLRLWAIRLQGREAAALGLSFVEGVHALFVHNLIFQGEKDNTVFAGRDRIAYGQLQD